MAESYIVPASEATYEFTEKHSRFIGHIFKIETAEQASEILARLRKKYWDATHNVYAYVLSSGTERFSDDGEPSGETSRVQNIAFENIVLTGNAIKPDGRVTSVSLEQ